MPGNELGDRVHNFFAADNSLQGQCQSQVVEGNWPVLNNNFWVGSQRQIDVLSSSTKSFHPQNSDFDGGQDSHPFNVANGLNFSESNLRSDVLKIQTPNEQPKLNGYMHGDQFHQSKQNDGNFLALDTDSDRRHLMSSIGLSVHEAQITEHPAKALVRPETSVPSVSLDLFGGQRRMSHQQSSMLQSLQRQPSGLNDMQQQQLMIGKMQELQRQQQLRHLDLRQQNFIYQASPIAKQASGSQPSTRVNGTPDSEALQYPWPAELGTNWLNHGSSTLQGSPNGLVFPPNLGQSQPVVDLVPRQVDQSLYGVPVSSSRGLSVNQYSLMETNRFPMPEMPTSSSFLQANRQNLLPEQAGNEDGTSISRLKFQSEDMFGHTTIQSMNAGIKNMGGNQQLSSMQRNTPHQNFLGSRDLAVQTEISGKKMRQVSSPRNEIALDPTEEKILFGSDDDVWAGFGKIPCTSGEPGNLFDNGGLLNVFPSIQSGSWSALMQSAVAETTSGDVGPREGWNGLTFHSTDGPVNQPSSMHVDLGNQETTLTNDNMKMHSPLRSSSIPLSDDTNNNNAMELNQFGHKFQNEPGQRLQTEMSLRFVQSMEEAGKWSNFDPLQKSVAEGSQVYRNASQHSLEAEGCVKTISTPWVPGRFGTRRQQNDLNALEALSPGGDRVLNINKAEKMSQNSQNNQFRPIQGDAVCENSLRNSNAVSTSAERPKVGNAQVNEGIVSLNNAASIANSSYSGVVDETSPFVHNNFLLNQWKTVNPSTKSEGSESLARRLHQVNEHNQVLNSLNSSDKGEIMRHEADSYDLKENSIDCHRSNLSIHTSVGFRESGLSDASNSRSLASGKQKSTNQLSRKVAVPRKFQYHPMGNIEEDVGPTYAMKQPIKLQVMPQQSTHFGVSKIVNPTPRDSTIMDKGQAPEIQRANKGPEEEPFRNSFPVHMPSVPVPFCRPFGSYIPNKASSSGQNMLELLHKVDQSRDCGAMMHLGSSECNPSSQQPETEKNDGPISRLQRSQSSTSQGFGLQLGPPSEWLQIPDHSLSSQNAQGTVNLLYTSHAATEMIEKGHQMVPGSAVQYLPFPDGESQIVLKNNKSTVLEHVRNENSLNKIPLNFHTALSSGTPHARSHLQNQQIERGSGKLSMKKHIDSPLNGNDSRERGSAETIMPDASGDIEKDNVALSWGAAQQTSPNYVSEGDPALTASTRDIVQSSQHFGIPGISLQEASAQMLHNKWTNVSRDQQTLVAAYQVLSRPNIVESSSVPQTQIDIGVCNEGNLSSELSTCHVSPTVDGEEQRLTETSAVIDTVPKMKESPETASLIKNHRDDSPSNSASVQKDIEAFGRTLKPNRFSSQNYSLTNQMRTLKDAETDPSNRASKKMKGPDNILDAQQVVLMSGRQDNNNVFVGDSLGSSAGVLFEDSMMLRFSKQADYNLQCDTFQHGNEVSENIPQRNSCSDRVEYPQVSPQMAPSWFNQYGALKKGEMLSVHNASKVPPLTPGEPSFDHGKPPPSVLDTLIADKGIVAATDSCQIGSTHQGFIPTSVVNGHLSSPLSSHLNVTDQHLVILKTKKRKSTSELHPWHKEILEDSQKFWTLSVAEAEWSKATNRLKEKDGYDAELAEDGPPLLRSKRRLVLTTQLMKQLFCPPPAVILSTDAISCFEDVTYAISRIALGDACSTVSHSIDLDMSGDNVDQLSAKGKPSDRNCDQSFMKCAEEFMGRTRKLENDFARLDKAASLLDLRLECQDLEKFSVINRFAKFHGRGQNDNNADTASINGTASTQKPCPQRYVAAVPVPRSLPDRVQCLSL